IARCLVKPRCVTQARLSAGGRAAACLDGDAHNRASTLAVTIFVIVIAIGRIGAQVLHGVAGDGGTAKRWKNYQAGVIQTINAANGAEDVSLLAAALAVRRAVVLVEAVIARCKGKCIAGISQGSGAHQLEGILG